MAPELHTIDDLITVLGQGDGKAGRRELMRLTRRKHQHVTNWLAADRLPSWTWLIVSAAAERRGYRLSPAVCRLAASEVQAS